MKDFSRLIGTHVMLEPLKGLQIRCRITNAKTSYGRPRVQIEPIKAHGQVWVNFETVQACPEAKGQGGSRD